MAAEPNNAAWCSLESILDEIGDCAAKHSRIACELRRCRGRDVRPKVDPALPAVGVTGRDLFQQPAQIQRPLLNLTQRGVIAEFLRRLAEHHDLTKDVIDSRFDE